MKYLKLFENFDSYDPYELMIIPPNKKSEMIIEEIRKSKPNLNLVSDLIVLGANVDWRDEYNSNRTPLHVAAITGRLEIARMLIDAGANVNVQDDNGYAPLHVAAKYGNEEILRMLIDAGANVNVQSNTGWTPLHDVAYEGNVEIARILIDAKANVNVQDEDGRNPYYYAETEELKNLLKS
jgi:ankyrin repeat protein